MSGFAIKRIAFGVQIAQALQGIVHLQQGPLGVVPHATEYLLGRGPQVDHRSGVAQALPVRLPQHDAPAGGEDPRLALDQVANHRFFEVAEGLFTFTLEKLTDRAARSPLDHIVGVREGKSQPPGELPPDGGFSRAGQADQADQERQLDYRLSVQLGVVVNVVEKGEKTKGVLAVFSSPATKLVR
jgi:hypothetical protein